MTVKNPDVMTPLSGGNKKDQKKEKLVYMSIPSILSLMVDIELKNDLNKYVSAFSLSLFKEIKREELEEIILKLFGKKSSNDLKTSNIEIYTVITKLFGTTIWS